MTSKRRIIIEGDIARIPLTRGYVAIIDAADVSLVEGHDWTTSPNRNVIYAMRGESSDGKRRSIFLHRVILGVIDTDIQVDHIDLDGLNNRRANLRACSKAENLRNRGAQRNNTSGFKGVTLFSATGRWHAQITVSGSRKHLGFFDTREAAHAAYVEAASRFHGRFARSQGCH